MAIQFFCPACRQPIEVDDIVANQTVTCPYCSKVVTTPAQSDPAVRMTAPSARPSDAPMAAPPPMLVAAPKTAGNKSGWGALICVVVCLVSLATMTLIAASVLGDGKTKTDPKELQKRLTQTMTERPILAAVYVASLCGSCGVPIVGAVLAIVSLAGRKQPRWPAILSLCLLGVYMILMCLNFLGAMAGMKAPAT